MLEKNNIILGDCLDILSLINEKSIDMVLTDLPYQITNCKWDISIDLNKLWLQLERVIKDDGVMCFTTSQPFTSVLITSNFKNFKYELIWDKIHPSNPFQAKFMPLKSHENICIFYKKHGVYNPQKTPNKESRKEKPLRNGKHFNQLFTDNIITNKTIKNSGLSNPKSILQFLTDTRNCSNEQRIKNSLHPTQKPILLFEYLIKTYTNEGMIVLDCCAGSGTTAIACINTNRNYICIEKDEGYFNIIKERIKNHVKRD